VQTNPRIRMPACLHARMPERLSVGHDGEFIGLSPIPLPPALFRRDVAKGIETAVALAVELGMPPSLLPGPGAREPDTR
jgi:hypothetical protein